MNLVGVHSPLLAAKKSDCNPNRRFGSKTACIPRPLEAGQLISKKSSNLMTRGLTIVEVLVAIVILSIVLVAFAGVIVANIRQNAMSGNRTAAAQVMNYLGRRAVEGDGAVLPASPTLTKSWAYNTLRTSFPDLTQEKQSANPNVYRAEVINQGLPSWTASAPSLTSYTVRVCWNSPDGESCVESQTLAPISTGVSAPAPLNGLN
jgi:prepilin-type N-terminal cleavage/methylation domain-containing protein